MRFIFTFGQKYRNEAHPSGLPAHPDGVVAVNVSDSDEAGESPELRARAIMHSHYGPAWAFCYPEENFKWKHFPRGIIASYNE